MTPTPPDISLAPEDWYWATWRRLPPLPRPAPRPFDRPACLSALAEQFEEAGSHYLPMDWKPIFTEKRITPDEACFWMEAIRLRRARQSHDAILADLETYTPDLEETQRWFRTLLDTPLIDLFFWPLMSLLPPAAAVQIVLDDERRIHESQRGTAGDMTTKRFYRRSFMRHFRSMALPYLSEEERAELRALVRPAIERARWPATEKDACASFYLAAALGMHDVIHQILEHTRPEQYYEQGLDLAEIIFGLDSADAVREQIGRIGLRPTSPQHVRAWIAHTELESLEWVAHPRWAGELSQIRSPAIAPHMLRFLQADLPPNITRSWLYPIARGWLYANAEIAVAGLLALPRHDPIWPLAERWLRQKGLAPILARHPRTKRWPKSALITPGRTPAWLAEPTQARESDETPHSAWVDATMLPPISYRKKLLTHDQLNAMLEALRNCNGFDYEPLAEDLARHISKDQLDVLGSFLFTYWLEEQPTDDMWILYVLGMFATDTAVRLLTSMLQTWEDCDDHLFTADAINGLGMIASDAALHALDTVTQDIRLFSLHASAHANRAGIADYRNISFNKLLLHLAPTCGMDGSLTFGIGGQRLIPALDADLHPILRDDGGRTYRDLPGPPEGTPADEAEREAKRWQQHRRAMRTAVRQQAYRLQQHMINQHHWSAREMRTGVLRHPLLGPLARRLLWAGYRAKERSYQALLFSDDQSVVDEHYRTVDIGEFRSFTLAHPVLASPEQRRRWIELLNDFAIIPFFPQASRPVFALGAAEHTVQTISIAPNKIFTDYELESLLRPKRWASFRHIQNRQRYYARYFSEADITAVLFAYPLHDHYHNTEYRLNHLLFIEDHVYNYYIANRLLPMHLSEVDPIIISEVLWDLSALEGP